MTVIYKFDTDEFLGLKSLITPLVVYYLFEYVTMIVSFSSCSVLQKEETKISVYNILIFVLNIASCLYHFQRVLPGGPSARAQLYYRKTSEHSEEPAMFDKPYYNR